MQSAIALIAILSSLNTHWITEKQYFVEVAIYEGDPRGTKEAGTKSVLSRPRLLMTEGQKGYFFVGYGGTIEGTREEVKAGISIYMTARAVKDGVLLDTEFTHTKIDESVKGRISYTTQGTRIIESVKPYALHSVKLCDLDGKKQRWMELKVHPIENQTQYESLMADEAKKIKWAMKDLVIVK